MGLGKSRENIGGIYSKKKDVHKPLKFSSQASNISAHLETP